MANVPHRIHAHATQDMVAKLANILRVRVPIFIYPLSDRTLSLDDPRLVQCYRRSDCSRPSRIGNESMSLSYCCGNQAGVATASTDGSCTLCSVTDEEIANATAQVQHTLSFATCVLWGRDHFRTFDGFFYDFQGTYVIISIHSIEYERAFFSIIIIIDVHTN